MVQVSEPKGRELLALLGAGAGKREAQLSLLPGTPWEPGGVWKGASCFLSTGITGGAGHVSPGRS